MYVCRGCWVRRKGMVGEENANPWGWHMTKTTYQLTWYRSISTCNPAHNVAQADHGGLTSRTCLSDRLTQPGTNVPKMRVNFGAIGWVVNSTTRPLYPPERNPVPIVQDSGCVPRPVWTSAGNPAPNGIRPPDRPSRSKSLFRPSNPGLPTHTHTCIYMCAYTYIHKYMYIHSSGYTDVRLTMCIMFQQNYEKLCPGLWLDTSLIYKTQTQMSTRGF